MLPRIALVAGLAAGCGGAGSPAAGPEPVPAADDCVLRSGGVGGSGAVVAAATETDTALLDPARARTPLGLSCAGRPVPRVASAWSTDASRTAWTLVLPAAGEVAARWREPPAAAALRAAGAESVVTLDDQRLVVTFRSAQETVPRVFAHPALAEPPGASGRGGSRLRPTVTSDPRDALDAGAAIVLTADPAVLEYAGARPDLLRHALPWNRTYVLLTPEDTSRLPSAIVTDSGAFREALARDAVAGAARAAEPPFWWEATPGCARPAERRAAAPEGVIYPRSDPVARALAERIVAIAGPSVVARAVAADELANAIAGGSGVAYVVPLPRLPLLPCREIAAWPAGARGLPLIDTRPTAIVRQGTPPITVDHDGALLVEEDR